MSAATDFADWLTGNGTSKKLDALSRQIEASRKDVLARIDALEKTVTDNDPRLTELARVLHEHTEALQKAMAQNPTR